MNRMIRIFSFIALLFFSYALSAQTYKGGVIDKTVALVGNDIITISQLETEVQMMMAQGMASDRSNIRCEILENILTQKLFLTQARLDSLVVNLEQVEMELQSRIDNAMASLGGEKAVEDYFKKPLHKLKNDWREILSDQTLTQQMQQNVMKSAGSMTPSDVEKFYKKVDKAQFGSIYIELK